MYVNFFQPSLKLLKKERIGAKVSKKYDSAKTPFQRILLSEHISDKKKKLLTIQYESLDPIGLMSQLQKLQDELWRYAWKKTPKVDTSLIVTEKDICASIINESKIMSIVNRQYRTSKKIDLRSAPRNYRTRPDPFEKSWDEIRLRLEIMPATNAKEIVVWLMEKYPDQYKKGQIRTLQRRIAAWRKDQESQEEKLREIMVAESEC
jgi:hypothetical protein